MVNRVRHRTIWATALLLAALLTAPSLAQQQAAPNGGALPPGVRVIENPSGGRIYLGGIGGPVTPEQAMGKVMRAVIALCGDRPQLGKIMQSKTGEILAGFFTVTGTKLDGKPMKGLAIVYAPKTGSAGGAVLLDDADRFPTTGPSMFAKLKETLGAFAANSATTANGGSDRPAAGMSSGLRDQTGGLAGALTTTDPKNFQPASPNGAVSGIEF